MTLPKKVEKGYLQISDTPGGFAIVARQEHAAELIPLFRQHDIKCHTGPDAQPEHVRLFLATSTERAKVQEILEAYKNAKGS